MAIASYDVEERDFEARVVERSTELPVVVDFWAAWCGPCRTLTPALESAIAKREGAVELAKVDVDRNQTLAATFGVRGIPAVKAFRDGKVAAEFTGAIPPAQIDAFLDRLVPTEAEKLTGAGDEASLRAALDADPRHAEAAGKLGKILVARGDLDEALTLLDRFEGDFVADGLAARARLQAADPPPSLASAFGDWDAGESEPALEALQGAITSEADTERRDDLRKVMVAIFTELGADHPLARAHRRRLATALA
jgi:putative thioredoxin